MDNVVDISTTTPNNKTKKNTATKPKPKPKTKPKNQMKEKKYPSKSKNGKNSPVIGDNGVCAKPGDNSKIAAILLQILRWGNVDRTDINALEYRFCQMIDYCINHDVRISNQMMYLALGLTRDNVFEWERGETYTKSHADFIKKVKSFCASYREQLGVDSKLNPITLIWWQKNYDGFVDKSEVVYTPNNPLGELKSADEIRQRMIEGVVEEDED